MKRFINLIPRMQWRGAFVLAVLLAAARFHAHGSSSDVIGTYKIAINPGANFVSMPLQKAAAYSGEISGLSGNTIQLKGSPSFTANQFGPRDAMTQYIVVLKTDASATPGNRGDWWPVTANTTTNVTVNPGAQTLSAVVAAGDEIEIRPLVSFKDIFGTAGTLILNKDSDGAVSSDDEDVIRFVTGLSFGSAVFYHDGSLGAGTDGYYVGDTGPLDGSTITIGPDEGVYVFRKASSSATNAVVNGIVHTFSLTHYLEAGANPIGTGFPVEAPIGASNLQASGWGSDSDGIPSPSDEDLVRTVSGTSFVDAIFHHNSGGSVAPTGWYVNDTQNDSFPLTPGKGLFIFARTPLIWRQTVPFTAP